ncbi:ribosome-associated ATPase/putative transporter RbbA [Glaciecola sp. XM2]|nr:ribosome-associated ATPase/putative transporter RbbA [Glaciecola sp. XM2]
MQHVLTVNHVSHAYGKKTALNDVSMLIPEGQMVGLVGPDGVGKSSLMGLIAGARKLQHGKIEVLGGDIDSASHRTCVSPRIAYMPQGLGKNLYAELSVAENLDFFGKLFDLNSSYRKQQINALSTATGLHPFLSRPAGKLSGGMKQKLGLCCSLIHDPDLLLLDEPTTGVDPLSRRQFWELIAAIRADKPRLSILVSTAYMNEAEQCDLLFAMDDGKILARGTPLEIKQQTNTNDIEAAFIALLPEQKRKGHRALSIPELNFEGTSSSIVAKSLTKRFGDFTAVDNVSFDIKSGEIFGFLGSNGCGKTTTMKMLTGLLPVSDGEAYLFGQAIDASNIATRYRVGFMSQSFSLYTELSARQNMVLHAKLFDLDDDKATIRIRDLASRFGLTDYMDTLASSMPLGIRQRLSLAIAIIHEPEILILDEPTSGVDPVARDDFWQLLVELSRNNKVTIFISTHFMNEAMRCDRISLMHAGKVLACDTPNNIIKSQRSDDLEGAFIRYLESTNSEVAQDIQKPSTVFASTADQSTIESDGYHGKNDPRSRDLKGRHDRDHTQGFSLRRLLAYTYLEAKQIMRDPVRLSFAFLGSALLLIVVSYGTSLDVDNLRYAVYDQDQSPQSREYLRQFEGSRYFIQTPQANSVEALEQRLKADDIALAIEVPPGFGRDLIKGDATTISIWIDGANTLRSNTIESYVEGVHAAYLVSLARNKGYDLSAYERVSLQPRFRYNPSFETIYSMGPKVPAMLLLLIPAILMAVSIAREKEMGTVINFYVTPTKKLEYLLGKQVPYVTIGFINFIVLTLLVVFVLQVPLKGDLLGLSLGAVLYVIGSTAFGMLIASLTKSQVAAIFATTILSIMPTLQFSGIIQPTSTLEGSGYVIGTIWPATYYMHLSVAAFTKGLSFIQLLPDLMMLMLFGPFLILVSWLLLKKQEA